MLSKQNLGIGYDISYLDRYICENGTLHFDLLRFRWSYAFSAIIVNW